MGAAHLARLAVVATALASVGCIAIPEAAYLRQLGTPATTRLPQDAIRVLVWNVYKSKIDGWAQDFEHLAESHDLLLLQEGYWSEDTTHHYTDARGIGWWMAVTIEYTHSCPRPTTGTVIGTRALPLAPILALHSPYREALAHTPKSFIATTFAIEGVAEPLLTVSVHGTNLQIEQRPFDLHMDQIIEQVSRHRGPVLLAGDFNTWSEARTQYLFDRTAALGLNSVFDRGPATTERDDGRMSWSDNYLDHAFVRDLTVEPNPRVLRDLLSSDHKALSFTLLPATDSHPDESAR